VTVFKEVQLLSSVFNMAIREGVTDRNPCVTIPTATKKKIWAWNKRERFLSPDEEVQLFAQLKGRRARLAPIVRFELETGLRKSELCRLEVRHVNLSTKVRSFKIHGQTVHLGPNELLVEKNKNGKARVIPLTPGARRIAEFQIADATTGKYLFTSYRTGGMITEIKTGFTAAVRDEGLEDFRFHDLRHTFATRLNEAGADLATIRDVLGHSSTKMASDYTQTSLETRRRAIEAVSLGNARPNYGKITAKRGNLKRVKCS
jgi:integrase